jgi:hypothetical protein
MTALRHSHSVSERSRHQPISKTASAGDTIFLERNAPSDLQRNIARGDGRDGEDDWNARSGS